MPRSAARPCRRPGCPNLTREGRYCAEHRRERQEDYEANRPSSSARGYDARWQRLRKMVLARDPLCSDPFGVHGDTAVPATDVDHIVPRSQGGTDDESNLQTLCHACHSRKTVQDGRWG